MREPDEDDVRAVIAEYAATKRAAIAKRDAALRAFHAAGWRAVDLQRVTGYSRETIRQALHPAVRSATNTSRRKTSDVTVQPPADYVAYGDRKRYAVAETLAELRGPTSGTVTLPHSLDWSGNADYVLDRPARLASMYRTILTEARTAGDLRDWLDGATLVRLWSQLWLPAPLRNQWEIRFPELEAARTAAA